MYNYWRGCGWGFGRTGEAGENRTVMSVEDEGGKDASLDFSKLRLPRTFPHSSNHLSLVHFKWVLHLLIHGSAPASIIHYGRCV